MFKVKGLGSRASAGVATDISNPSVLGLGSCGVAGGAMRLPKAPSRFRYPLLDKCNP